MNSDDIVLKKIANLMLEEDDKIFLKEMEEARLMPISVKTKRNDNAFVREELRSSKAIYPEADNAFERLRTKLYLRYPHCPWLSRLYKSRKRRGVR